MRDPDRIDQICEALKSAWRQYPDERLGQFLMNTLWLNGYKDDKNAFWNTEDETVWLNILSVERPSRRREYE